MPTRPVQYVMRDLPRDYLQISQQHRPGRVSSLLMQEIEYILPLCLSIPKLEATLTDTLSTQPLQMSEAVRPCRATASSGVCSRAVNQHMYTRQQSLQDWSVKYCLAQDCEALT